MFDLLHSARIFLIVSVLPALVQKVSLPSASILTSLHSCANKFQISCLGDRLDDLPPVFDTISRVHGMIVRLVKAHKLCHRGSGVVRRSWVS